MDVYKVNIQSDGFLNKRKLRFVVRGDLQSNDLVGYTWSPTAYMRPFKYFWLDAVKHKAILHQSGFIGEFLQDKIKNRVFRKLESRYADYFSEYLSYFGISFRLLRSMC